MVDCRNIAVQRALLNGQS